MFTIFSDDGWRPVLFGNGNGNGNVNGNGNRNDNGNGNGAFKAIESFNIQLKPL